MGYLDSAGLSHFTAWVKARLSGKQDTLTPDGSIDLQGGNISVALPTKSVTKAEYAALSEAEKQAETVYLVEEPAWTPVPLSIQEYDTEDGWHVRKWSSGYVEMFLLVSAESTERFAVVSGSPHRILRNNWPMAHYAYPFTLTKKYAENMDILRFNPGVQGTVAATHWPVAKDDGDLSKTSKWDIYSANDGSGEGAISAVIRVTGRWK